MLDTLFQIEKELRGNNLLCGIEDWESLDITYHPPRVERLWRQVGQFRLSLHRIHHCKDSDELFHPHPWPSAMRIIQGLYEMKVGYGIGDDLPPVAAKIILSSGNVYEMTDPNGWHSVRPLTDVTYTVIVTGMPWERKSPKSTEPLVPLMNDVKAEILSVFYKHYHPAGL